MLRSIVASTALAHAFAALVCFSGPANAISDANRSLATDLFFDLGWRSVDAAGADIQRADTASKAELADCFYKLFMHAGRLVEADIAIQNANPDLPKSPSKWAPFAQAAQVAHTYASGAPGVQNLPSYQSLKYLEAARTDSERIAEQLGMDVSAMKRQAEQATKSNLRTMVSNICQP